jgi:hypothetical protein
LEDEDDPADVNVAKEIAKFRAARNWPDDGAHSVEIVIVSVEG